MSRVDALIYLGLSGQDFGPCYTDEWTHAEFAAKWRGQVPCPTAEQVAAAASAADHQQRVVANTAAIQAELDRRARAKGYDNIVSACSYAAQAAGAPFQAEGAAFVKWRSDVWTQAYAVLAEVQAGSRSMPTPEEAVAMMPALVLP